MILKYLYNKIIGKFNSENLKIENIDYNTEFMNACEQNNTEYLNKLFFLIDLENINIYQKNIYGETPFMVLCKHQNYQIIEKLFYFYKKNDKLFELSNDESYALMILIKYKPNRLLDLNIEMDYLRIFELLVTENKFVEYINHKDIYGLNLIYYLIKFKLEKYVYRIFEIYEYFCDLNIIDEHNKTILNYLLLNSNFDLFERIIEQKKGVIDRHTDGIYNIILLLDSSYKDKNNHLLLKYLNIFEYTLDEYFLHEEIQRRHGYLIQPENQVFFNLLLNTTNIENYIFLDKYKTIQLSQTIIKNIIKEYDLDEKYLNSSFLHKINWLQYSILFLSKELSLRVFDLFYKNISAKDILLNNYYVSQTIFFCILKKYESLAIKFIDYINIQENINYLPLILNSKDTSDNYLLNLAVQKNMELLAIKIAEIFPETLNNQTFKINEVINKNKKKSYESKLIISNVLEESCKKNLVNLVKIIIEEYDYKNFMKQKNKIFNHILEMTYSNIEIIKPYLVKKYTYKLNLPKDLNQLLFDYMYSLEN